MVPKIAPVTSAMSVTHQGTVSRLSPRNRSGFGSSGPRLGEEEINFRIGGNFTRGKKLTGFLWGRIGE